MSVERSDATLRLNDGTELLSDLWTPAGQGSWPALLMRQPYGRRIASTVTLAHPSWWAEQGYLVVVQDVRGQGDSAGRFTGFDQEAVDTAETHAWVRNLPHCNGRLGCYGFSYQGLTQLVASDGATPPDCMAPAMTGLNERDHWSCEGGAHWWHLGLGWGLQLAALKASRDGDQAAWLAIRQSLENGNYLRDGPSLLASHDPDGMAWRWLRQDPQKEVVWTQHTCSKAWLQRPMLLIGGWWDPHLLGILDLWKRSLEAGGEPQLHIGPATHLQWWSQAQHLLLGFFDQHLKGRSTKSQGKGIQLWNLTRMEWETSSVDSVADSAPSRTAQTWNLIADGLACLDQDHGLLDHARPSEGVVCVVHDPWRPVPAVGGHLSPSAGAADRSGIDCRGDVACFTSDALEECLTLEGQPMLMLQASADQPGFDLCVALSRLPSGSVVAEPLSTGVLRVCGEAARTRAFYRIRLQPLLASLFPGDRLRVSIAAAAWPAIGINPGDPLIACGAPSSQHRVVSMTLHLAGSQLGLIPFTSGKLDCN